MALRTSVGANSGKFLQIQSTNKPRRSEHESNKCAKKDILKERQTHEKEKKLSPMESQQESIVVELTYSA